MVTAKEQKLLDFIKVLIEIEDCVIPAEKNKDGKLVTDSKTLAHICEHSSCLREEDGSPNLDAVKLIRDTGFTVQLDGPNAEFRKVYINTKKGLLIFA